MSREFKYYNSAVAKESGLEHSGVSVFVSNFLELVKIKITVFVAFTTALGYILAADTITLGFVLPVAGIFLLACSSAALNHYQERKTDGLMARTMGRPLPSGSMTAGQVLFISFSLLVLGSAVLVFGANTETLIIGLATFISYNFIYTPLKKKISLAIIPGSVVGALPPVAGWAAAGGNLLDEKILLIAAYFFLWQIPHFWILILKYGEDYKKADFPVLTDKLPRRRIAGMIFYSTLVSIVPVVVMAFSGMTNFTLTALLLVGASVWLSLSMYKLSKSQLDTRVLTRGFIGINFYTLAFITLLMLDKLINII